MPCTLQHAITQCIMQCNKLQHTLQPMLQLMLHVAECMCGLPKGTTICNTLHTLQHTATNWNALLHAATQCTIYTSCALQYTTTHTATPLQHTLRHTATRTATRTATHAASCSLQHTCEHEHTCKTHSLYIYRQVFEHFAASLDTNQNLQSASSARSRCIM